MDEQLIKSLADLGLSQKEARVYLANLLLGPATVQNLAEFAGIKRVTAYVILESLISLGLASQTTQGKKTFFHAEEPANLQRLLAKKEQQVKEQKHQLEEILPQLKTMRSLPSDSPTVKFYDSKEGIKGIVSTYLSSQQGKVKTAYGISNLDQLYAFFPEFEAAAGNPERPKTVIASKFIYTTTRGPILKATDAMRNRESRFVPPDKYPLNADINIVGNHVILLALSGSKPIGITIESHELALAMLAIFQMAWAAAASYHG
jgi:sugar-specific transcriptional regulator TrmB